MRDLEYEGFRSEAEFRGYLAELERRKRKHEARSAEAVRQDRCRKRRRCAENYWEHFLRTGGRPESWLEGLSPEIIDAAKNKMVRKYSELAKLRGLV